MTVNPQKTNNRAYTVNCRSFICRSVDTQKAMALDGVVAYVRAADVTGVNKSLTEDYEFLVTEQVHVHSSVLSKSQSL